MQKSEPAELSKTNRIHKAQKRFTALKRLRQISRCQLLQPMQTIGQTQREQGLSLTHHLARTQTGTPGRNLQGVDAEMGGEILLTGLRQGIRSGLLVPVGHQRALITAGGVIATRFQGVIDHQHQPMAEAAGHLIDATKGVAMPFRRPPGRGTQRGQAETAGFGHAQCLSPQIVWQRHRHARQRRGAIRRFQQLHPLAAQFPTGPDQTLHRQRVQQLMGQNNTAHRFKLQIIQRAPLHRDGHHPLQQ